MLNFILKYLTPARITAFIAGLTAALEQYADAEFNRADELRIKARELDSQADEAFADGIAADKMTSRIRAALLQD